MDELTAAIDGLTRKLHAYLVFEIKKGTSDMALEIKGLRSDALAMRANIERLRNAYKSFNELAPAHAGDVEGLAGQVSGMGEDLAFAVNILGNSTSELEKPVDRPKPSPEVADGAAQTFRAAE